MYGVLNGSIAFWIVAAIVIHGTFPSIYAYLMVRNHPAVHTYLRFLREAYTHLPPLIAFAPELFPSSAASEETSDELWKQTCQATCKQVERLGRCFDPAGNSPLLLLLFHQFIPSLSSPGIISERVSAFSNCLQLPVFLASPGNRIIPLSSLGLVIRHLPAYPACTYTVHSPYFRHRSEHLPPL
jgi:hypothetical protein